MHKSSHQRCFVKKVFSGISQNLQEITCYRVSFLIKFQPSACNFLKKETLSQVCSCKFCEISKNTSFYRTPLDDCFWNNQAAIRVLRNVTRNFELINRSIEKGVTSQIYIYKHVVSRRDCKKGVLRNFVKFTGKHLCQSLFFNNVAGLSLQLYLKRDTGTSVFLWILQNF